jgi:hypothetical protein
MSPSLVHNRPRRITDLVELKKRGAAVSCSSALDIIPIDFSHRSQNYKAFVFIGRFSGTVNHEQYTFRKCYARGCKHDLCPRVSQAVMIANRYLERDYNRLEQGNIEIDKNLFTLEGSVVRLSTQKDEPEKGAMIIDDCVRLAKEGAEVSLNIALEYAPAIEHFEYHKNRQTFLLANFALTAQEKTAKCQRCLGCYQTERELEEKPLQIEVANERLSLIYKELDLAPIRYEKQFFA